MAKLYIDTNVIIDAVEGRKNLFGKNLGNPAADLFSSAISCKHQLIISTWLLEELYGLGKLSQARMFFEMVNKKTISVTYTSDERTRALQRSHDHRGDALHILIAERERADVIVTRNVDDFLTVGTSIPIKKPEELL